MKWLKNDSVYSGGTSDYKYELSSMRSMGVFIAVLMGSTILFSVYVVLRDPYSGFLWSVVDARNNLDVPSDKAIQEANVFPQETLMPKDKLPPDDLLPTGFDESSCISRYESLLYRKQTGKRASPHLIAKLRRYEALHKKCGPYTELYNKTVENLKSYRPSSTSECQYIVWIPYSGLGNRILTLASSFLYALITNRVLLVDRGVDMLDLFCEPFPKVSWLLPLDFPLINQFNSFNQKSHESYGNLQKSNSSDLTLKPHVSLYLAHDYDDLDKLFFCNQDQIFLQKKSWLIVKTNQYFIPSLFLIPSFEQELKNLFPDKEMVFHLLGRYLFHPTNSVWGLISRYYQAYLSKADVKVGIQVRVFDTRPILFKHVLGLILDCTMKNEILPQVNRTKDVAKPSSNPRTISVLMTSLNSSYFDQVRNLYWENPTSTGEVITVHQPSHEEYQQTNKQNHDRKAWAEMYLLSLTDKLVTSSWSTFGYVAQGLGGLKPWILYKPINGSVPDPACRRAMSMEPCFHYPPSYDCHTKKGVDIGNVVPHVRHCEDTSRGIKLASRELYRTLNKI